MDVTVEDGRNRGRLGLAVRAPDQLFLFEFKLGRTEGSSVALAQLWQLDYAAKHRHLGVLLHLVSVEFSTATENVEVIECALA